MSGVFEAMRESSDWIKGEWEMSGGSGRRGCVFEEASGDREERIRACAAEVDVGVGGRSMSVFC